MNDKLKYISVGVSSLALGFVSGYLISNIKAGRLIKQEFKKLNEMYDESIEDIRGKYEDALDRATKSGAYSTVQSAGSVLIPDFAEDDSENEDILAEALEDDLEALRQKINTPAEDDILADYRDRIDEDGRLHFPGESEKDHEFPPEDEDLPDDYEAFQELEEKAESDNIPEPTVPGFVTKRDPNGPYVISIDEYMDDEETPFIKQEMTWFEEDATLVDSRNAIVPNIDQVIGLKNLDRFGEGTTDPEQVYIRNERMEIDVEVTKDDRSYGEVILGILSEKTLKRQMTKPLKMRDGDDD